MACCKKNKRKPGICALFLRLLRMPRFGHLSFSCKCGFWFLLLNVPLGYGGMAAGAFLSVLTHCQHWLKLGICSYLSSWVMLGAGTLMAGPELARRIRRLFRRRYHAWRRLREMRPLACAVAE